MHFHALGTPLGRLKAQHNIGGWWVAAVRLGVATMFLKSKSLGSTISLSILHEEGKNGSKQSRDKAGNLLHIQEYVAAILSQVSWFYSALPDHTLLVFHLLR